MTPADNAMDNPTVYEGADPIAPMHLEESRPTLDGWAGRLVLFIRVAAGLSLLKGLYHWAAICGFGMGAGGGFETRSWSWQTATVFFAIIDLVAGVGLWLGAPWGATIWLTSSVTMIVVHVFLPQIYGFQPLIVVAQVALIAGYVYLSFEAAREQSE
jgi:hypothetical protein